MILLRTERLSRPLSRQPAPPIPSTSALTDTSSARHFATPSQHLSSEGLESWSCARCSRIRWLPRVGSASPSLSQAVASTRQLPIRENVGLQERALTLSYTNGGLCGSDFLVDRCVRNLILRLGVLDGSIFSNVRFGGSSWFIHPHPQGASAVGARSSRTQGVPGGAPGPNSLAIFGQKISEFFFKDQRVSRSPQI